MDIFAYVHHELLITIPALVIIGQAVKNLHRLIKKYLPLLLMIVSVTMSVIWSLTTYELSMLAAVIQGILCAGAATWGYETVKQFKKQRGGK